MRKQLIPLILLLIFAASISVFGQSKKPRLIIYGDVSGSKLKSNGKAFRSPWDIAKQNTISLNQTITGFTTLNPNNFVIVGGANPAMLMIHSPKNGWNNQLDSIIIHVKKQKLRWINDSTAVISK